MSRAFPEERRPEVVHFSIPKESLNNVILAWWISRYDKSYCALVSKLKHTGTVERHKLLSEILMQDLPIREFVPVCFIIDYAPRAFWDQLDRSRAFAFWEQSLRVRDLDKDFSYFVPTSLLDESAERSLGIYESAMDVSHTAYIALAKHLPRDLARGVIPLHIVTRGSAHGNLRSLLGLLSTRMCYFAQGEYWRPIVNGLLKGLWETLPFLKDKEMLYIPCTGKSYCAFEKDIMDRIDDKSNPLCPVMIDKFVPDGYDQESLIRLMVERYPTYVEDCMEYADRVGISLGNRWVR